MIFACLCSGMGFRKVEVGQLCHDTDSSPAIPSGLAEVGNVFGFWKLVGVLQSAVFEHSGTHEVSPKGTRCMAWVTGVWGNAM